MYGSTWLVSTSFGVLLMFTGTSVEQSAIGTSAVALAIMLVWTFIYCSESHMAREAVTVPIARRAALSSLLYAIAIFLAASSGKMEAAAVTRKLRKNAAQPPTTPSEIKNLENVLYFARNNRVPVADTLIRDVGSSLTRVSSGGNPKLATSAHQAVEATASLRSYLTITNHNPDLKPRVFDGVQFSIFDRDWIHGVKIAIDKNQFWDCLIEDCTVVYQGGPVALKNTTFVRCDFEFSEMPSARELLLLLTQKDRADFTFMEDALPVPPKLR
jgi:hypothetical protein